MEQDYWLTRWQQGDIGFHQDDINPYLRQYWHELNLPQGGEVFVPLCGKSRDMLWLRNQRQKVLGVELSDLAVQAFFSEQALVPERMRDDSFVHYRVDDIDIRCGNFFDLGREDLASVQAVYDRASLVALPPAMRQRYASYLLQILPPGTQILLIAFDYPQAEMAGPPFAVTPGEVAALYQPHAEIRLLAELDVLAHNPRFRERGLSQMRESIFLLTLR
ncbi:thiopurine S-methyltransferase [Nitrosomonas halophila]|uniref:Thiopurine S-methyltransferase n=1 Tax=Nitrosomonas halophila TaxID=44576 RepID=A0A1H3C764_9PROT|nr:thiopurine S-methyltransferase [Nitrosomonas halophila]SDX50007.1 thiopurine S-methyltransferase [Nitrosomonas halophila]